jgi:hypothetical protein
MADMRPGQFSLRRLLIYVAVIGSAIGGLLALQKSVANAHKEAVRQAIREGRMDGEAFRGWFTADEFDQLRKEAQNRP